MSPLGHVLAGALEAVGGGFVLLHVVPELHLVHRRVAMFAAFIPVGIAPMGAGSCGVPGSRAWLGEPGGAGGRYRTRGAAVVGHRLRARPDAGLRAGEDLAVHVQRAV